MSPPGLLVSVRSAAEAREAVRGGASVIDVKEPDHGPLGMADPQVWARVREAVPQEIPVSVALGDLRDWARRKPPDASAFLGIGFRKMGLAGEGADVGWPSRWQTLRNAWGAGPPWVAVIYADWESANAPRPREVVDAAAAAGCAGVLIDTWDKRAPSPLDASWRGLVRDIRDRVGGVVLAGGLDADAIRRLAPLAPDLFASRGAACGQGDRRGVVDAHRVAALVAACGG